MNTTGYERAAIMRTLRSVGNRLSRLGLSLAAGALLVVIVFNFLNVMSRYVFFHAIPWAEELMLYLSIFSVYAGAVSVAWEQRHIRLDGLFNLASPQWRWVLPVVSSLIVVGILTPIVISSSSVVLMLYQFGEHSDALEVPMWIPQIIVPVSLALIVLVAVIRIFVPELDEGGSEHDTYGRI